MSHTLKYNDFTGFRFNGVHSSELGLVRVSNGSRYDDTLLPTFQDKTAQIPGGHGTLYWESFYVQKPFTIQVAYDSVTEDDYRRIRQLFNAEAIGELIFDELPYKAYTAKVSNPPQLKWICFNQNGQRIYKGEGTINFVCYRPFAHSVYKYLDEYIGTAYANKSEWAASSNMLPSRGNYDSVGGVSTKLYNAGDMEADFCLYCPVNSTANNLTQIALGGAIKMKFTPFTKKLTDTHIRINSRTNLVEGMIYNTSTGIYTPSGLLYNEYISAGDFFKIPTTTSADNLQLTVTGSIISKLDYNYLYF